MSNKYGYVYSMHDDLMQRLIDIELRVEDGKQMQQSQQDAVMQQVLREQEQTTRTMMENVLEELENVQSTLLTVQVEQQRASGGGQGTGNPLLKDNSNSSNNNLLLKAHLHHNSINNNLLLMSLHCHLSQRFILRHSQQRPQLPTTSCGLHLQDATLFGGQGKQR